MEKKDNCKFVDVFYGNGETDHFALDGLASKWFYIKALCGNTFPHPVLPFGKIVFKMRNKITFDREFLL